MAVIESWFAQDLKKPVRVQYLDGVVFTQDNAGNLVGVNVFDEGEPASLSGTVSANVIRSDGGTVAIESGTISGNQVSVVLPQAAYAVPGVISIIIKITASSVVTTICCVVANVYKSTTDMAVDPGTIIPSIQTLISEIDTAVASIPADYSSLWTTLAPAYSTSATYAVGQYVTYNGGLYRCISAITTAESWTAAHWSAAKVGPDLSDLKSAITQDLYFHVTDTDAFAWKAGYRVNSTRKDYTTSNVSKYAGLYKNSSKDYLIVYPGSTITANTGYTMDYAITSADHSTSIEGQRGISAGTTITIQHKGVLILSVSDGTNDVGSDAAAKLLAKAGLTIDLITSTEAATKVDKDQGVANAGKLLKVGSDGIVTPVTATDTTLQQSGVPADAKTVGENILLSMDVGSIVFTIGGFNAIGTTNDTLTTQVRTKSPVKVGKYGGSIGCDEGYEIRVFNYSAATFSGDYLISKTNFTSNIVELIPNTYVGFSIRNTTPAEQSDVSNSEHFVINIPEQTVAEAVEKLINGDISSYNHGPFDLYKERFCEWYSGLQSDYTEFVRTSQYADIITAFDALMALDTAYITKNSLGTASGTDSQGNSYTIYEYVFKPKNYSSTINARKVPKIYMDGSIHGFEKCGTYGLYYFLKDLVTNWDKNPSLAAIRQSVEIHVIPVSNPYGFDNFIYKNANSVNINRNFDHNGEWIVIPDGSDQNGLAAFDQPESAIIRDWLLADEGNILCYLNLHTNGQWNVSSYGEMNANMPSSDRYDAYYNRIFRAITNHIEEQTIRWPSMYENIQPGSSAFCGKIQASVTESSTKGTASAWANTMRRIVAMTFEGFNGININDTQIVDTFSAQAQKMNSENIGNIVIQMIREYVD